MLFFLQQQPIVVDVVKQPTPTRDISIDYVITMFQTAGIFLLIAAVGGLIVGAIFVVFRRFRDASTASTTNETDHVKLRI
jgi:hypothetical protein